MRRRFVSMGLFFAALLLLSLPILIGCTGPAAGTDEEVSWKWNSLQPRGKNWIGRVEEGALVEVSERTEGKFTIDFYASSSLGVDPPSLIQAVGDGLLDCSELFGVHVLGDWPLASLVS